ncbi:tetratricopeptide repeat protein [Corallococcus sp. M34]|uniref:tetratricopeptide repeat protein n=1 Tax=Citreicoccus inhibens TaxID=2849499 RepID=UPI001C217A61|nr:tetratricopeptide repeat protein [Citreicoccus inhibens]MBU8899526.1 tetratricopeptide repeat protein [Citreicoccus inhibens]
MAKSMVERYEQLLRQDPTSSVFVELAKLLLEKGEAARAIEVCAQGVSHHAGSTVGRVLWGKALIQLGRPAEAMEQFDQAIAIEKDNPYAYNLIGEVLLQRGLYRSALPILRKAVTLQPNDGRVKLWLEQAQQAVSGGPAPIFADLMGLEKPAEPPPDAATAESGPQARPEAAHPSAFEARSAAAAGRVGARAARTSDAQVRGAGAADGARASDSPGRGAARGDGDSPGRERETGRPATAQSLESRARGDGAAPASEARGRAADDGAHGATGSGGTTERDAGAPASADSSGDLNPERGSAPGLEPGSDAHGGSPFGAEDSESGTSRGGDSHAEPGSSSADDSRDAASSNSGDERSESVDLGGLDDAPGRDGASEAEARASSSTAQGGLIPELGSEEAPDRSESLAAAGENSPERDSSGDRRGGSDGLLADLPEASGEGAAAGGGGLLGELPPPEETGARRTVAARAPEPVRSSGGKRSLLDDIPDAAEVHAPSGATKVAASAQDTEKLAAKYEQELREKLAKESAKRSFLARNGVKLASAIVATVFVLVSVGAFVTYRARQGGQTLKETLDRTSRLVSQDTRASLDEALKQLDRAHEMDDGSSQAWALTAYVHALLFADHGMAPDERQKALEALEKTGVKEGFPGLMLATNVLVADDRGREPARRALLASTDESTELHALAGSLLLAAKDEKKALERFDRALKASPTNVRALVALGGYYLASEDHPQALEMFRRAREVSPEHPAARIGMAESRLALEQELDEALADVAPLATDTRLPAALQSRQQLVQGQLLSALGRYDEARALLSRGAQGPKAFDFQQALGAASRAAGKLDVAQQAYEAALKLQPKSEEAREGLGRTLLDRDREREALQRLEPDGGRKVSLVRGAAYARLGDWKRARAELARTRVNDRYSPEAIAWLALADAAEGNGAQAREVLEKALAALKRPRNDMRVALGQVYWRERALDKAQTQFEEAMKNPREYEAACSLGRLLLSRGLPDMALAPLTKAVERNGAHGEARDALGRTLLALGRAPEALKQFETWQLDNPGNAAAHKGFALALYQLGRRKDAEGAVGRAVKLAPDDAEGQRIRAAILFAAGDGAGGFAALERANKLDPKDPETFCEIAQAFLRQDNVDNAEAAFAAARREGPDVACGRVGELYAQVPAGGRTAARTLQDLADKASSVADKAFAQAAIARVQLGAGALKEARTAADEAVKLAPFTGRGYLALGLVALKQRQEAPAKEALLKAVELEPTDGLAQLALADLLVREPSELTRAVDAYEAFLRLAGGSSEASRVKKALPILKRKAAK